MPRPTNPKPINAAEHDALVARLRATGGDVAAVAAEFNRGRNTVGPPSSQSEPMSEMTNLSASDQHSATPKGRFLRMRDLVGELGLSESTINRLHRRGDFPPKVQLSPNCTGWWANEVEAWKAQRSRTSGHH